MGVKHHWEILVELVLKDLKSRYAQSVLGWAWAVLQPLSMMLLLTLLGWFLNVPSGGAPYPLFVLAALLPWTFFSNAVSQSGLSLVSHAALIRKIYFPRVLFPLASCLVALMDFLISLTLLAAVSVYYGYRPAWCWVALPLVLAPVVLLSVGIGLAAAGVGVIARDTRFVVPFGLQLWLYATPVIYPVAAVPASLRPYILLNPLSGPVEAFRQIVLSAQLPSASLLLPSLAMAVVVLAVSYAGFRKFEMIFADVI
jgi:lipopolysaccharide transport system permease protein